MKRANSGWWDNLTPSCSSDSESTERPHRTAALTEGVVKALLVSKLREALSVVLVLVVMATGATFLTSRTATGQEDKKPNAEKPKEPGAAQAKEPFTAWGKEVGGLQAGLGFRSGERRAYRHGETVTLVVRVRNVGKEAVKLSYFQPGIERTLKVTDGDGQASPQPVVIPGDFDYERKAAELAPGKEIDLYELKRQLRPAGEGTGKILEKKPPCALYGTGKVLIQYDKLVPESTDKILGTIATGKLELDVKDAERGGNPELKTTDDKKASDREKPQARKELAVQGCWTLASKEKDGRVVTFNEGDVELVITNQFCVIEQQGVDRLFTHNLSPP